jgi:predicted tellurium resistance membrane protein TerC
MLQPETWIALATLSTLEIVLGVDNLVFIAIAVGKLPPAQRPRARRWGLAFACLTRIALLVSLAHLARMDDAIAGLFTIADKRISVRDLVLILGGLFLVVKGAMEIHETVESDEGEASGRAPAAFALVIAQIALLDIVFSLDSVITAVGMVDNVPVMIAAIVIAVLVMIFAANPIGDFIDRHPTVKMLALAFLVLVGLALICDGVDLHIPRGYLYFAMAFAAVVESLNLLARRRRRRRGEREDRRSEREDY